MNHELSGFIIATFLGGLLSLILCIYASIKIKHSAGGKYYILVTAMSSFFTFSYGFELLSQGLDQKMLWVKMEYLALPFIPVFIFLMCLDYVGKKLRRAVSFLLFAIPVITISLNSTNEWHYLYYSSVSLTTNTPYPILQLEGGVGFIIHSIFLYSLVMASMVLLLLELINTSSTKFKMQIILMVTGLMIPIIASILYVFGLSPNGIDIGPVFMCVSFVFHGIALFSFKMFDVIPVARKQVFESMSEGVLVINQMEMILDYNQSMMGVIPTLNATAIGQNVVQVLGDNEDLLYLVRNKKEAHGQTIKVGKTTYYEVKCVPLKNRHHVQIGKIITFINVTKRVLLEQQLTELASMDGLTQIYNRATFLCKSEELLKKEPLVSILMFDIDHFKRVNDTYGHFAGDEVLQHFVRVVKSCLREEDLFGRFGGEEFVICMPNTSIDEASTIAETICHSIATSTLAAEEYEVTVTTSIGISSSSQLDKESTVSLLIRQADEALYRAKEKGRNCVVQFESQPQVPDMLKA